ncbi:hypothetical protein MED193_06319 [Roseobacter sp. MED193]|uniref:hypothetical protein n=1 Tax=Roseobacter sp. MED193 TaxID=314262 RepID=UPI000068EE98|nr:hypothetical protein [Roseobacter sp. MED193]EAQ45985.1 hypothetical protein MED193_06319 [Roseobacter sp. MED193]
MNYFIDQNLGSDVYSNRGDFSFDGPVVEPEMDAFDAQNRVVAIADHYTAIINSSETVLFYLCFDLSIGIVKRKTGYAMDPIWANGVYEAAKVDFKVYTRLAEVVSENLTLNVAVPAKLRVFAGEVMSGMFPVPNKQGPAITRDKLRNLAIFESVDFLCEKLGMQFESDAKETCPNATALVSDGFSHVEYVNSSLGKPTPSVIKRIWKREHRAQMRYEVSMLRWLENKEKSNRWYKKFGFMFWMNRNLQNLNTCVSRQR